MKRKIKKHKIYIKNFIFQFMIKKINNINIKIINFINL